MSRILNFLLFFSLPFQLSFHYFLPESLVLGRRIDYLAPTLYISDIFLVIVFFQTLFTRKLRMSQSLVLSFLIVVSIGVVSVGVADVKSLTVFPFIKLVELACFVWLIISLKPTLKDILLPLGTATLLIGILAIAQFMTQQTAGGLWYWLGERSFTASTPGIAQVSVGGRLFLRPYGTFPHPNVLGGFMSSLLPLWLWSSFRHNNRFWYLFSRAIIFSSLVLIGLSFSRIAWFMTFFVLIAYVMVRFRQKIATILTALVFAGLILSLEEMTIGRFASLFSFDSLSVIERQKLQSAAFSIIASSPILGIGLGQFIPALPIYMSPPYLLQPVHSIYLLVASETGLIGLSLFLTALCLVIYRAKSMGVKMSMLVLVALGLFDHYVVSLQQAQLLLALLIGLAFIKPAQSELLHVS